MSQKRQLFDNITGNDGDAGGDLVVPPREESRRRTIINPSASAVPPPQRQRSVFGGSLADLFGLAGFQLLEPQLELLRRKILRGYAPRLLGTRERFEVHHTDCRMLLFTNDLTGSADQAAGRKPCNCWC